VVKTPLAADGWLENVVSSPDPGATCPKSTLDGTPNPFLLAVPLAVADMPAGCKTATPIQSMRVEKTSNPGSGASLSLGELVTYTITISNTGQAALTPAAFTDSLAGVLDDATLEAGPTASSGNVSYAEPVITWSGDLPVGGSATVTYSLRIRSGGDGQLNNVVVSEDPGTNCGNGSSDAVCATAALVIPPTPPTTVPPPSTTIPNPGELPATGGNVMSTIRVVLLLALAGTGLILIARRRRRPAS
jgi:uncharacterized repeat protein (TIGR01451 family)/LPXTG-motif cell wall-anchored protein